MRRACGGGRTAGETYTRYQVPGIALERHLVTKSRHVLCLPYKYALPMFRVGSKNHTSPVERRTSPLTPSGSASFQLAGCTLSSSWVLCSSIGDTPISTSVEIMSASRETTPSRSAWVSGSPPEVVGKRRVARSVQESYMTRHGHHKIILNVDYIWQPSTRLRLPLGWFPEYKRGHEARNIISFVHSS